MEKLKKINSESNIITWFEIPIVDTARAKKFYESILAIEMSTRSFPETKEKLTFFPYDPKVIQATSGRVTGVLKESPTAKPSKDGTVVYINASPEIQFVLDKVKASGGEIIVPKTEMNAGFIAIIMDSEGNKIGLHAEK